MHISQNPKHIRIFLSSPGDVRDERRIALKVLEKLPYDAFLRGKITLEVVAWDKPGSDAPMLATMSPQEAINEGLPLPEDCDIVVVLFWLRMGTPLPSSITKPNGDRYLSGTEWEYLNAFDAARKHDRPYLIVYRRMEDGELNQRDPEFDAKREQFLRVENFFDNFTNPDGSIEQGYNLYNKTDDFREAFENHMRQLIKRVIETPERLQKKTQIEGEQISQITIDPWQGSPFPGLRSFTETDERIFFGRGRETDRLLEKVKQQYFVAVIGASGSGKSSIVAAGLIPRLRAIPLNDQEENPIKRLIVKFTPSKNPFNNLMDAIADTIDGVPSYLIERGENTTIVADNMISDPQTKLFEVLSNAIGDTLWHLTLFVDQFEELFTLTPLALRAPVARLLATETSWMNTIVTMRADFYHQALPYFDTVLGDGSFPLDRPSPVALHNMIVGPALQALLRFEDGLADEIVKDTGNQPGSLALMAYLLDELYQSATKTNDFDQERLLSRTDYVRLGGVQGAIGSRAKKIYSALGLDAQEQLPIVFRELLVIGSFGAEPTRRRANYEAVTRETAARHLVDRLIDARLLVSNMSPSGRTVEVAHEALFRQWQLLSDWIEQTRDDLRLQEMLRRSAQEWVHNSKTIDYLWSDSRRVEASKMIRRLGWEPDDDSILEFVQLDEERWIKELEKVDILPERRREIGQRLALLDDPRKGVGLTRSGMPNIGWESASVANRSFKISRYPITVQQYRAFLEHENGYNADEWWQGLTHPDTLPTLSGYDNYPVTNVNWEEALAFCRWLSAKTSKMIRLPTVDEFQSVQTDKPSGNNYSDSQGEPVSVGVFTATSTQTKVYDTYGNVFQWGMPVENSDQYHKLQAVVKYPSPVLGASYKYDILPSIRTLIAESTRRHEFVGFRVVESDYFMPEFPRIFPHRDQDNYDPFENLQLNYQPTSPQKNSFRERLPDFVKELPRINLSSEDFDYTQEGIPLPISIFQEVLSDSSREVKDYFAQKITTADTELMPLYRNRYFYSERDKNRSYRYMLATSAGIICFVILTSLAVLSFQFSVQLTTWLGVTAVIVALLTTFVRTLAGSRQPFSDYLENRRLMQQLGIEYLRFMMDMPPYSNVPHLEKIIFFARRAASINNRTDPESVNNSYIRSKEVKQLGYDGANEMNLVRYELFDDFLKKLERNYQNKIRQAERSLNQANQIVATMALISGVSVALTATLSQILVCPQNSYCNLVLITGVLALFFASFGIFVFTLIPVYDWERTSTFYVSLEGNLLVADALSPHDSEEPEDYARTLRAYQNGVLTVLSFEVNHYGMPITEPQSVEDTEI